MKRWQHHRPGAAVLVVVEHENRLGPDDLTQREGRFPGVKDRWVATQDRPDVIGVGDEDERADSRYPGGEQPAVAVVAGLHEPNRIQPDQCRLQKSRQRRARGRWAGSQHAHHSPAIYIRLSNPGSIRIMGHREALLDGARRCLLERGYARTTARDLVAASGTNLASIGYHFGSKEALLNGAMQQCFDEYIAQITRIVFADPSATPVQRLQASWVALVSTFEQYRPLMVAFVEALAQAERVPELRAQLAECYERLRATVADMVRSSVDGLSDVTARQVASFLIAVYDGLQVQWLLDPERAPTPDALMAALEVALPAALATEEVGGSSKPTHSPESCS